MCPFSYYQPITNILSSLSSSAAAKFTALHHRDIVTYMTTKFSNSPSSRPSTPSYVGSPSPNDITVGYKVYVDVNKDAKDHNEARRAEILSVRNNNGHTEYYVHFMEFNKRLDEWVSINRIDFSREIERPSSKKRAKGGLRETDSSSPNHNGNRTPIPVSKKRKISSLDDPFTPQSEDADVDASPGTPTPAVFSKEQEIEKLRHSGSMTQSFSEISRVKNLERIHIGKYDVETWYFSPFPAEFANASVVYICEFCLYHFISEQQLKRHLQKCTVLHPPGNEIYRQGDLSFFEIDGHKQKTYCRNLCLLSKLFLDHKTLYYDVDPFLFYIMCKRDNKGCHIIGYFSKEKESGEGYNLACILTLPQYQRQGYGRLLISFSYELSKKEGKIGSPEKPLSDLGLSSYRAYWTEIVVELLLEVKDANEDITIEDISSRTSVSQSDILQTLQTLGAVKPYKGQQIILLSEGLVAAYERSKRKNKRKIDENCLQWTPPQFTSNQLRYI